MSACAQSNKACFPLHFNRPRSKVLSVRNLNTPMLAIQFRAAHFCSTSIFRLIT